MWRAGTGVPALGNKLKKSLKNARQAAGRRTARRLIEADAVSIAAKGILQNLVVEPELHPDRTATGFYSVTIGEGRRLAQLLRVTFSSRLISWGSLAVSTMQRIGSVFLISLRFTRRSWANRLPSPMVTE